MIIDTGIIPHPLCFDDEISNNIYQTELNKQNYNTTYKDQKKKK